jgi:two-component system, chemotaxis family, sensor kinase CheA
LSYTEAVVSIYAEAIHRVGNGLVATHLGRSISIVFLKDLLGDNFRNSFSSEEKYLQRSLSEFHPEQKLDIIIVSHNGRTVGFVVDKLHQQKEIVEKPLSKPVDKVNFISGVTILGNGGVCLVLNVATILNFISTLTSRGRVKNSIE